MVSIGIPSKCQQCRQVIGQIARGRADLGIQSGGVDRQMANRWRIGSKAGPPAGDLTQSIGDGRVAGVGAGGEIVDPVSSAGGEDRQQPSGCCDADIILGRIGSLVEHDAACVLPFA